MAQPNGSLCKFGKEDTTEINAKKAPNKVDKTAEDKEKVTEINKAIYIYCKINDTLYC